MTFIQEIENDSGSDRTDTSDSSAKITQTMFCNICNIRTRIKMQYKTGFLKPKYNISIIVISERELNAIQNRIFTTEEQ